MSERSQGNKPAWPLRKSLRFPGRARGRLRRGVSPSARLNLSPGSRQRRRRRAPGPGRPLSPRSSRIVCRQLFCSRKFASATPGMRTRSGGFHGCWTGRGGHVAGEGAFCPGRAKPAGRPRWGLTEWGAPAPPWLLHMARRAVRHGHTGRVTFLLGLHLQTRGSRLPLSGFHSVGRGRRTRGYPECGEGPRFALPQVASWAPPKLPTPARRLWEQCCGAGQSSGAPVSGVSRLARVPRPRTPPEAALPPSDRPGSLTRTVLRTMVNKEQLFAAFDEWDSASYRPHSESFRRYSPHSGLGGVGQVAPATFAAGTLGRAFVPSSPPPPPGSPCMSWCRWSQADGCSTGTNVC